MKDSDTKVIPLFLTAEELAYWEKYSCKGETIVLDGVKYYITKVIPCTNVFTGSPSYTVELRRSRSELEKAVKETLGGR